MQYCKEDLGKRIKEIRKIRSMTQPKLAELISVDPKYISRLETGTSTPSLDTLFNIAVALEVEVADLFDISHLDEKEELIEQLVRKLKKANSHNVRLIYSISNTILNNN